MAIYPYNNPGVKLIAKTSFPIIVINTTKSLDKFILIIIMF